MYCTNCGTSLSKEIKFCTNCGHQVHAKVDRVDSKQKEKDKLTVTEKNFAHDLPHGYTDDKAAKEILKKFVVLMDWTSEEKTKLLLKITAFPVLEVIQSHPTQVIKGIKSKFPNDIDILGDNWKLFEDTIVQSGYISTAVYFSSKSIGRDDIPPITVPDSKAFTKYFADEMEKCHTLVNYTDTLLPPHIHIAIDLILTEVFRGGETVDAYQKTGKEFQVYLQKTYKENLKILLAAYSIQDSFVTTNHHSTEHRTHNSTGSNAGNGLNIGVVVGSLFGIVFSSFKNIVYLILAILFIIGFSS